MVIDGTTNATSTINAGTYPYAVAVNPATNKIYVANDGSNDVTVIDGASGLTTAVAVGTSPRSIEVNTVTNKIYVANSGSSNVTVIDGNTNSTSTVFAGIGPIAVGVNAVTNKIYVANTAGNVAVINGATNAVAFVPAGTSPRAITVNAVTNKIYVANGASNNVTVLDGTTNVTTTIAAGSAPQAIWANPVTGKIYVANGTSNDVSVISGPPVQAIPLTVGIGPLPGNVTTNTTPSFTFTTGGTIAARRVYYQIDTAQGSWMAASGSAPGFTGTTNTLGSGTHIVYAYATDGQDATSVNTGQQSAPLIGQIAAYVFTVNAPTFTVSPSAGVNGSITPAIAQIVIQGNTATFTVTPNSGYAANVGGTCVGSLAGNIYTTNPITANCTVAASFNALPATVPGAPVIGTAIAGDALATVTFMPPPSDGGSAITGYAVTSSPADGIDTNTGTTGLSHTIANLLNGTAYTFTVTALNAVGPGAASAPSSSVTPTAPQGSSLWANNCSGCHGPTPSGTKLNAAGTVATVLSHVIATQPAMAGTPSVTSLTPAERAAIAAYIGQQIPASSANTPFNAMTSIDVGSHITLNTISFTSVEVVNGPVHGTLTAFSGTSATYTPAPGFSGTDTFTYRGVLASPPQTGDPRTVTITVGAPPLALLGVQSRKTHGAVFFDLPIDVAPLIGGLITVEPRTIGAGHTIVFQFDRPISTPGIASAIDTNSASIGNASVMMSGSDVMVTLANVPDNKRVTVSLGNVNAAGVNASASLGFLVGDVNNSRAVNSSDISGVKARSGQSTDSSNFKFDLNVSGSINSSDISAVKARSGLALPP